MFAEEFGLKLIGNGEALKITEQRSDIVILCDTFIRNKHMVNNLADMEILVT